VVTALEPVRAEQVKRPERKQNRTMPHCGSVLPICLSLRPVGPIHIIIETVLIISCSPRADIGGPNCQHYLSILFLFFLTEAAQYFECSCRRTAHHVPPLDATSYTTVCFGPLPTVRLCPVLHFRGPDWQPKLLRLSAATETERQREENE